MSVLACSTKLILPPRGERGVLTDWIKSNIGSRINTTACIAAAGQRILNTAGK
eukprot:m.322553 g.322553  ORF g.322553 m.322553 type:complete len:53 (+) comp20354_c1_seq3:2301-2459(+)